MSEDLGAWIREQRFGHIVAQTASGGAFSLDLFETPDLLCRGFYLPLPAPTYEEGPPATREPRPLAEVELRARQQVLDELREEASIDSADYDGEQEFVVQGDGFVVRADLNLASQDRVQGAEVWTGRASGEGPAIDWTPGFPPEMAFGLERYGSPELIILIVAIYLLIHMDRRADELDEECWRRAVEACGERRIKRYRPRRTLLSLTAIGLSHDCEFECK